MRRPPQIVRINPWLLIVIDNAAAKTVSLWALIPPDNTKYHVNRTEEVWRVESSHIHLQHFFRPDKQETDMVTLQHPQTINSWIEGRLSDASSILQQAGYPELAALSHQAAVNENLPEIKTILNQPVSWWFTYRPTSR